MSAETVNTAIKKLVDQGDKLRTTVKVDLRVTDGATTILMDKESAIELAHQIITGTSVFQKDRIVLTVMNNSVNSMSVTSY